MKTAKILILLLLVSSCVPQQKLRYLQTDSSSPEAYNLDIPDENKITPGDYLNINVKTLDERNFFSTGAGMQTGAGMNEFSILQNAYLVDPAGEVELPEIGKVNVSGLSLIECSEKLQKVIKSYLTNPTVDVRYAYKTYIILGEVNSPGRYNMATKTLNIFGAIAQANDLTFYGQRNSVFIIREIDGQTKKIEVDLTDDDIMLSPNYYIQDNDIILVNSRNYIRWEQITTPLATVVSSVTLFILILNLLQTNPLFTS